MKKRISLSLLLISSLFIISCSNDNSTENNLLEEVICNAEQLSADSSFFVTGKKLMYGRFSNGKSVSSEQAKSGLNSIKLTGKSVFGLTYIVDEVESGDIFNIEVWVFGASNNANLVVSANKSSDFYKQNNKIIETDDNGWSKISMEVVMPFAMDKETLKIYVWNSDKNKVLYFDDLKISYLGKKK